MTSGRTLLADALREGLPGWQILSDARVLDSVKQPGACVLWTAKRAKVPSLGLHWFQDDVTLYVLTASDRPELVEDSLDELLLTVAQVLEPLSGFHWDTAERATLDEKWLGYRIPVTCVVQVIPEPVPDPDPPT